MLGKENRIGIMTLSAVVVLCWCVAASAARPKYRIEQLDPVPNPGTPWSLPKAINQNNVIVGQSAGFMEKFPTRWEADGSVMALDFSVFPAADALAINDNNWAAGLTYYTWDIWQAVIWAPDGTDTMLGGFWTSGEGISQVNGINNSKVAVGTSSSDTSLARAFRWTEETGMVDLGTFGGEQSVAAAINNLGVIVGHAYTATNQKLAYVYDNDTMYALGLIPGGTLAEALDINDAGVIVGCADKGVTKDDPIRLHAVIWDPSVEPSKAPLAPIDIGVPFPGGQAFAVAVNKHYQVVGNGENPDVPGDYHFPWIWEDGVMTCLQELIPPGTDWILDRVTDINDEGRIVGVDNYGRAKGFVLIPLDDVDIDMDGDVDDDDFTAFVGCMTGPSTGKVTEACVMADFDEDKDVDLMDFGVFMYVFLQPMDD